MAKNFRARLKNGEILFGTLLTLNSPEVAELLAEAGFDWLFLDAEHGPFDMRDLLAMLQGAGRETECLIRIPALDEAAIKKALDLGPAGLIVPQINSAEQAQRAVQWARYPPIGSRGVGVARAQHYGLKLREYLLSANDTITLVVQAESIEAVDNIQSIVRVPGIDAVLIGVYDLSGSLGRLGEVEHPEVLAAIEKVARACQAAAMPLGIFGASAEAVKPYLQQGFTLIVAGVDTILLGNAARQLLARLKA